MARVHHIKLTRNCPLACISIVADAVLPLLLEPESYLLSENKVSAYKIILLVSLPTRQ